MGSSRLIVWVTLAASLSTVDGRLTDAVALLRAGLRLAAWVEEEDMPCVVSFLMSSTREAAIHRSFWAIIGAADVKEPELDIFRNAVLELRSGEALFRRAIAGERVFGLEALRALERGEKSELNEKGLRATGLARLWLLEEERQYLRSLREVESAADEEDRRQGLLEALEHQLTAGFNLTGIFENAARRKSWLETLRLLTLSAVELRRERVRTGSYPESLEAIAGRLPGGRGAIDAYGRPLEYRKEGAGFVLSSAGPLEDLERNPSAPRDDLTVRVGR